MAGLKRPPGKARPRKVETGELARLAKALGHPARIEILRTLHSFDPCLACSTHVMSPDGEELATVKVR